MSSLSPSKLDLSGGPKPGHANAYPAPQVLIDWLEAGRARSAYFGKVDSLLPPPLISKIRNGRVPVTFEYAIRLERAQKPSAAPFKAVDIMTFEQDRQLYRYVTGQEPAPDLVIPEPRPVGRPRRDGVTAGAGA